MSNEEKAFLQAQLDWCQSQDHLLSQIEQKFHQMKHLAESVLDEKLAKWERDEINEQFLQLQEEVAMLEKQLHGKVH